MSYETMRTDIQSIIKTHGMQADLLRETEDVSGMGDTKDVTAKGYTIFFIL